MPIWRRLLGVRPGYVASWRRRRISRAQRVLEDKKGRLSGGAFGLFLPLCALFGPEQARLPSPRDRDPPRAMDATRTAEVQLQ